jgi:uncharacterized membrane protein YhaH (DUF805 family)
MAAKKKLFWIVTLIVIAAVIVVICVSLLTGEQASEFDGTLVRLNFEFPKLL